MNVKPLFDAAELLSNETKEVTLTLTRILDRDPKPTITIKINDDIREKQGKLFKKYNDFVMRIETDRGKLTKQEGHIEQDRLEYAKELVDLCVVNSSGLFDKHQNALLKKVFVRQATFLNYFLDLMTDAFEGDFNLDEENDKKN